MSYNREDWKYVAGILDRGEGTPWNQGFHEQNLPSEKDLVREIERLKEDCETDSDHIPLTDAVDIIKAINLEENQEYTERLHGFAEESFDLFCRIKENLSKLLSSEQVSVLPEISSGIEDVLGDIDGFFDTCVNLSWLRHHGPLSKKYEENCVLDLFPPIDMHYDKDGSWWRGYCGGFTITMAANSWHFSKGDEGLNLSFRNGRMHTYRQRPGYILINLDELRSLSKNFTTPTKEEKDAVLMIYPQYQDFYRILDEISKIGKL